MGYVFHWRDWRAHCDKVPLEQMVCMMLDEAMSFEDGKADKCADGCRNGKAAGTTGPKTGAVEGCTDNHGQ